MNEQVQTPRKPFRDSSSGDEACASETFSAETRAALEAGIASAKTGKAVSLGSFAQYSDDE